MEWDKIWNINKKVIDPVCPRHTCVMSKGKVGLTLTNGPAGLEVTVVPRHKKHAPAGNKATTMCSQVWLDQADAALLQPNEEVSQVSSSDTIGKMCATLNPTTSTWHHRR
jgi:glutamyl-tRNA synthetase